jgi:hypothetical protein
LKTRSIRHPSVALGLVEAAHNGDGDLQAWCECLLEGARALFLQPIVNIGLAARGEDSYSLRAAVSNLPGMLEYFKAELRTTKASAYDAVFRFPRQVGTMKAVLGSAPSELDVREYERMAHSADALGLVALADDDSLMIGVPHPERISLSSAEHTLLARSALHLEAGLRVRLRPGREIAVLRSDGKLLHAGGGALRTRSRPGAP